MEPPTETPPPRPPSDLSSLHPRLTVLQAAADEAPGSTEHLARLLVRRRRCPDVTQRGDRPRRLPGAARKAATRRVEDHERVRGELSAKLRRARELQAVTANRRDEAAARTRRMTAHLEDCDSLLERPAS